MKKLLTLFTTLLIGGVAYAQVTLSTYPTTIANNGQAGIVFQVETNAPIILQGLDCALNTTGSPTWTVMYRPGGVAGPPNVSAAGGWISLGSGSSSVTTAGVPAPVPVPLSLFLAPGNYGFFIGSTVTIGYKTWVSTSTDVFTDGIVTIRTGTNFGYGGPAPSPAFHPRQFVGALHYIPVSNSPNDAGINTLIEPSLTCEGMHDIKVEIENKGKGQIDTVRVRWNWNGVAQPQYWYYGSLDTANGVGRSKDTILLGTKTLVGGISYDLSAWTHRPNNKPDTNNYNDTINLTLNGYSFPSLNLGGDTTICPQEPITLKAGQNRDSILWHNSSTDTTFKARNPGLYYVTVWKNGCESKDSINITHFPQPQDVDFGPDTTICSGTSLLLDATTPGMTYLWKDNSTSPTFTVTTAGRYWVILEDANTCNSGDTIDVDVFPDPSVILTVSPQSNLCFGIPYTFTAFPSTLGSIAYQWVVNDLPVGSQTTSNQFTGPVVYGDTVRVDLITDICSTAAYPVPSQDIVMLINPAPRTISGPDVIIEDGTAIYAVPNEPTSTFVWRIKGGTITSDSTKNFVNVTWGSADPNAEIICEETDSKKCVYENVKAVNVVSVVGIKESTESIGLGNPYPNPAQETVTIPLNSSGQWDVEIDLLDITGKQIMSIFSGVVSGSRNITFSVNELNNGLYFYRLRTANGYEAVKKLTVSR